ncbi:MAG: 4'-phosphopantetheinyl transferase superfamily protein [Jatrophihabitantaceae bacterium]
MTALGGSERSTYAEIWLERRRVEWLAGRLAAKRAVLEFIGRSGGGPIPAMNEIRVSATVAGPTRGRPVVNHPVRISLSHSADLAVAAAGPVLVGVDVEKVRVLAPPLQELLRAEPVEASRPRMPLHLRWSCKEAVLKCLGLGMRADLRQVQLLGWNRSGSFEWRLGQQLRAEVEDAGLPVGITGWGVQQAGYSFALAVADRAA